MIPNPNDLSSTRANGFYRRRPRARPRLCTCLILYPFSRIHFRFSSDLSSSVQPNNSIDLSITRSVKLFFPFFIPSPFTRIIIKANVLKNPRARMLGETQTPGKMVKAQQRMKLLEYVEYLGMSVACEPEHKSGIFK